MTNKVAIIGAGPIAVEYSKILSKLETEFITIGRGESSAKKFSSETGFSALTGGIDNNIEQISTCSKAIIAVSEDQLGLAVLDVLKCGIKDILVEKPAASTIEEVELIYKSAKENSASVKLAYNRRYFSSVIEMMKRIESDGGLKSFHFEFTEWGHVIKDIPKNPGVKENWFFQNSSHVIDLAFFVAGNPTTMNSISTGGVEWHPTASNFAGMGATESGALFTYQANWEAPGRWALEFLTNKNRYYLKPMEKLQVQELGSVAINEIEIDDKIDTEFKPGFYLQTKDFVEEKNGSLLDIEDQFLKTKFYKQILNGN